MNHECRWERGRFTYACTYPGCGEYRLKTDTLAALQVMILAVCVTAAGIACLYLIDARQERSQPGYVGAFK